MHMRDALAREGSVLDRDGQGRSGVLCFDDFGDGMDRGEEVCYFWRGEIVETGGGTTRDHQHVWRRDEEERGARRGRSVREALGG